MPRCRMPPALLVFIPLLPASHLRVEISPKQPPARALLPPSYQLPPCIPPPTRHTTPIAGHQSPGGPSRAFLGGRRRQRAETQRRSLRPEHSIETHATPRQPRPTSRPARPRARAIRSRCDIGDANCQGLPSPRPTPRSRSVTAPQRVNPIASVDTSPVRHAGPVGGGGCPKGTSHRRAATPRVP